jgi:hypothetical protein
MKQRRQVATGYVFIRKNNGSIRITFYSYRLEVSISIRVIFESFVGHSALLGVQIVRWHLDDWGFYSLGMRLSKPRSTGSVIQQPRFEICVGIEPVLFLNSLTNVLYRLRRL